METNPLIYSAVNALNEAFQQDPKAIWTLMNAYTPCNEALANHPTVQVIAREKDGKESHIVGPLGLLNGVLEAVTGERVAIMLSDENAEGKRMLLGFQVYQAQKKDVEILARLSGSTEEEAERAITATINAFKGEKLTTSQIINKLAAIDSQFAVSAKDLAEAVQRTGAAAKDIGVNFGQLLAVVTSIQQRTGRGGAVIGNALKTIFTRFERADTKNALERVGVKTVNKDGTARNILSLLGELAVVPESKDKDDLMYQFGGTYQITILKVLIDTFYSYESVYTKALKVAENAADEAYQKDKDFDQSLEKLEK